MSVTELGLFHLIVVKLAGFYVKYVGDEIQTIILHLNPKRVVERMEVDCLNLKLKILEI